MKFIRKLVKKDDGQVLVLFALLLSVLLGVAALVVDIGMVALEKSRLQNAADAAALAGAQDLPANSAITTAKDIALENGVLVAEGDIIVPITPYKGSSVKIEVTCTRNVQYTFARVFGLNDKIVTARAVAEKVLIWDGEALPFINLDDDYMTDSKIEAWEKTGPGDFESIWKDEYEMFNLGKNDDHSMGYFIIDYKDGIDVKKGVVSTIKQEIGYIYDQSKPVYIFSLSSEVIKSNKYTEEYLKNKQYIPLEDLVLLQVTMDSYNGNKETLFLTVTEVYDINLGEYPVDYLNSRISSKLIE